ncbi:Zinc finger protein zfp-2 [Frankliniella fusca]|uniref:Zinc finger protein zfp-2 n=1 Tax=Frankliniella fusca TaxID=407009 RepID=A0AAE1LSM1_9NEOP|nr:Zinc finger protein zfp-2 [Frankliniella fusca]
MENWSGPELEGALRDEGLDDEALATLRDLNPDYRCFQCNLVIRGMNAFQAHLQERYHTPPFRCGEFNCYASYSHRKSLYGHLRDHHVTSGVTTSTTSCLPPPPPPPPPPPVNEEEEVQDEGCNLQKAAEHSILHLRSMAYMTTVGIEAVTEQCHSLMQNTATHLKQKVLEYLSVPDQEKNLDQLLKEFSIGDPLEKLKTKPQQLACFEKKYSLLRPQEVFLGDTFDSRQHPKRPRHEPVQTHRSYQYVSIRDILHGVMNDPELRKLILSEKPSSDGFLRSFRDGALYDTLPPDLKNAIRITIYVDDLEVLQALSSRAGAYKIAGIYFGIQNLPAELNGLLTYIYVVALAFADDAKHQEVWNLFLADMQKLETEGLNVVINGEQCNFKAVLVAQIGDTLAAHEVLGLVSPSCNAFCRWCYILRKEMWVNGTMKGVPRTPEKHAEDIRGCNNVVVRKASGVRGPPLIHGLRFFHGVKSSVPDIFHDLNQGVCKMEVKLALREYICKKKYLTIKQLNERVQFFDYGFTDKRNKPSPNFTARSLNDIKSYNLHQTGAQMWCLVRTFPFLLGDLIPEGDKLFKLICLLIDIMKILFAYSICEDDLQNLESLIFEHHNLFQEIFPGVEERSVATQEEDVQLQVDLENSFENPDDPEVVVFENPDNNQVGEEREEEELELPEENFHNEETVPHDDDIEILEQAEVGNESTEAGSTVGARNKKPKVIRLINKHHHMLHYVDFIRNFGPLILYWCIRYEAKHYFFKLCATVCHNFKNILKTLMEILQMKIVADRLKPSNRLTLGKRGKKIIYVSEALHRRELFAYGLLPRNRVYKVNFLVSNGVDYRPGLFVMEQLRTEFAPPKFSCIKAVYVSMCEKHIYLLVQEWQTLMYDSRYCAYRVSPLKGSSITVKEAHTLPCYRLLSSWTPEKISGKHLLGMDESDLIKIGLKTGPRMDILSFVRKCREHNHHDQGDNNATGLGLSRFTSSIVKPIGIKKKILSAWSQAISSDTTPTSSQSLAVSVQQSFSSQEKSADSINDHLDSAVYQSMSLDDTHSSSVMQSPFLSQSANQGHSSSFQVHVSFIHCLTPVDGC